MVCHISVCMGLTVPDLLGIPLAILICLEYLWDTPCHVGLGLRTKLAAADMHWGLSYPIANKCFCFKTQS